jgi:hypothetical protein
MSRFQFLIFTFVIAISLLVIVVSGTLPAFPKEIPAGVLTLIGISASTFAVSKGIQAGSGANGADGSPPTTGGVTHTTVVAPPEAGGTVTHTTVVSPSSGTGT